jgi:hypothetical protein
MYGFSVSCCMSSALSEPGGLGLGTLGFHRDVGGVGGWGWVDWFDCRVGFGGWCMNEWCCCYGLGLPQLLFIGVSFEHFKPTGGQEDDQGGRLLELRGAGLGEPDELM